jgi:hypothetical protein
MLRVAALVLGLAVGFGGSYSSTGVTAVPEARAQYCCKVCRSGQACGDSCISWDKTCRVGPGCACQG